MVANQAFFNYLFSGAKGFILYTLYVDYTGKLKSPKTWKNNYFNIDEDGYVLKAVSTFSDFTGFEDDTVRKSLKDLETMGFITKKKGTKTTKNIAGYKPELKSAKFLQLCNTKLVEKMNAKNEKNRNTAIRVLKPYIEALSSEKDFLKAIDMFSEVKEVKEVKEDDNKGKEEAPLDNSQDI